MRILVTGGTGQLGRSMTTRGTARGHAVIALGHGELDICNEAQVAARLARDAPDVVINAAAYTAVDKAETERERAFAVNRDGATIIARGCAARGIRLLHVSTDYVFDGTATRPYREDDAVAPLGVYGASKLGGERAVHDAGGVVVRTSWLFSARGPSFVQTMLRLAREREVLRVVGDQSGCPTCADDLADALIGLADRRALASTYHFSGDGVTTWHGFATAIVDEARRHRPLACKRVDAITTSEYPTPAQRPAYSVLDTTLIRELGIIPPSWKVGLARVIAHELSED